MGEARLSATFKEEEWRCVEDRFAMTASPLRADSKGETRDMSFAGSTMSAERRRASRRSSDILNATKQLDDGKRGEERRRIEGGSCGVCPVIPQLGRDFTIDGTMHDGMSWSQATLP